MAAAPPRRMHLATLLQPNGHHTAGWRHPDAELGGDHGFELYRKLAQTAERGRFDVLFLADAVGLRERETVEQLSRSPITVNLEPLGLLSALSVVTSRIGLAATASTTYNEPYHVARKFATLDHLSGGRAGWNVVTSFTDGEARNFNREHHPDHASRYSRAREFVAVVRGLWDSWDDDAFVRDKHTGRYFDPAGLHVLDHRGEHFSVRGPLNLARSPQGHPVIFQAGSSDDGIGLAAATADAVYVAAQTLEEAQTYYARLKLEVAALGRAPDAVKILPGIQPFIGRTEKEAQEKHRALLDLIHPDAGLGILSTLIGVDMSAYPLDGLVPDLPVTESHRSRQKLLLDLARRHKLTVRQLYGHVCNGAGHHTVTGTPVQIADRLQHWFENGAADGFNILPPWLPGGLDDFVDYVIPELQRRGLFRREYEGRTLRDHLGLQRPVRSHA
ncbi:LLM class flavin-dependent oxidoreductase [Caballeronia sp. LZ034LL]|uniref:LLM class flavin-dependent oxidoreductase n=1 Tax=Caballeronia sp. LZ034LL TaxID=3038567 RepID=UPI00285D9E9C|nr:LLM class flavin-dependent oxidoreductase [Caballeronia sp. LZ034LL]MDR5836479.1 LLM class flavin-dependent oxidoreductase [Caballeronia sp. LZ034LL]